jgi:hypothetical protein
MLPVGAPRHGHVLPVASIRQLPATRMHHIFGRFQKRSINRFLDLNDATNRSLPNFSTRGQSEPTHLLSIVV